MEVRVTCISTSKYLLHFLFQSILSPITTECQPTWILIKPGCSALLRLGKIISRQQRLSLADRELTVWFMYEINHYIYIFNASK